ncbi:MAG TPA: energy transducer TonB [Aequorivita sp.]|nr:energy transducer TonB [Aequorivita sp.]
MKTTAQNPRNKREDKKQINIRWNSRLFIQIGAIISLLLVFAIMETSFKTRSTPVVGDVGVTLQEPGTFEYVLEVDMPKPKAPVEKTVPVKRPVAPKVILSSTIDVQPDNSDIEDTPFATTDVSTEPDPVPQALPTEVIAPKGPTSIINVEFVPVYPGCGNLATNAEKIDCMSSKINAFINNNFRKELLEGMEKNQTQKIYVQFKIDSQGYIADVRANSNNARLKTEAMRVIKNLPTMQPGRQGDKKVDVLYTVPIIFNIQ